MYLSLVLPLPSKDHFFVSATWHVGVSLFSTVTAAGVEKEGRFQTPSAVMSETISPSRALFFLILLLFLISCFWNKILFIKHYIILSYPFIPYSTYALPPAITHCCPDPWVLSISCPFFFFAQAFISNCILIEASLLSPREGLIVGCALGEGLTIAVG